jgi:lauroyl/myristoyl acyltransferase
VSERQLRKSLFLRRAAAWGANVAPDWFVRLAPPIIGFIFSLVSRDARRAVVRNLRRIHGPRSLFRETVDVVETFVNFARSFTRALAPERAIFHEEFRVRGKHHVAPYFEAKQGVILLTAHVGPWDSAAMGLRVDVPVMMLMSPEQDAGAADLQDSVRKSVKVTVLRLSGGSLAALPIVEHLRSGGAVVAQLDRVQAGQAPLWVELFGQPFAVPSGLFRLAGAARVPLVPVFCARLSGARAIVDVSAPIFVPQRPTPDDLNQAAQEATLLLEKHLGAFPTQWFHFPAETSPADFEEKHPRVHIRIRRQKNVV